MKKHISAHNRKVLGEHQTKKDTLIAARKGKKNEKKMCNCRNPQDCPVEQHCQEVSLVYQADVLSKHGTHTYYGLTERTFKERFTEHKQSLPSATSNMDPADRKKKYGHMTELSGYAWKLHDEGTPYTIKWKIHSRAYVYKSGSKKCDLCLQEKVTIAMADPEVTLNSRNELTSKCRHRWKYKHQQC